MVVMFPSIRTSPVMLQRLLRGSEKSHIGVVFINSWIFSLDASLVLLMGVVCISSWIFSR